MLCTELRKYPNLHAGVAKTILNHRAMLEAHSARGGPKILDVPPQDEEGVPPLWDQMQEALATGWGLRGGSRDPAKTADEPRAGGDGEEVLDEAVGPDDEAWSATGDASQPRGENED